MREYEEHSDSVSLSQLARKLNVQQGTLYNIMSSNIYRKVSINKAIEAIEVAGLRVELRLNVTQMATSKLSKTFEFA